MCYGTKNYIFKKMRKLTPHKIKIIILMHSVTNVFFELR